MILKEEDAKKKVCPEMSEHGFISLGDVGAQKLTYCMTHECMAWQPVDITLIGGNYIDSDIKTTKGYCRKVETL